METLRARLSRKPIVVAPGVYDAFTALVATQAGFETLYVSGAAIAYTKLARPDVGLTGMSEVAETIALIRDRVGAHLIVDADTGYGNALNVVRTVKTFERAGANAIQLEDQDFPKRCGHLDGKVLIPADEMVGKIKAALDTRVSSDTLVIARTDAVAVEGFGRAIERAGRYREAGADVLFVEAPKTQEELARVAQALPDPVDRYWIVVYTLVAESPSAVQSWRVIPFMGVMQAAFQIVDTDMELAVIDALTFPAAMARPG